MSAPNCGSDNNYKNDLYTNYDNEGWNDINNEHTYQYPTADHNSPSRKYHRYPTPSHPQ